MTPRDWDRAAIRIRIHNSAGNGRSVIAAALAGGLGAMAPTAYFDRGEGAGAIGGAYFAVLAMTICAPVWLTGIAASEIAGDDENGLARSLHMVGGNHVDLRVGAIGSAGSRWGRLVGAAALAGLLVGVGDGLRKGDAVGLTHVSAFGFAGVIAATAYVLMLGTALSLVLRRTLGVVLTATACAILGFVPVPVVTGTPFWVLVMATPFAPLFNVAGPESLGRFALQASTALSVSVAAVWFLAGCILVYRSMVNSPQPGREKLG